MEKASVRELEIDVDGGAHSIAATLALPHDARALIVFAHGSGSSRHSPRNQFVARELNAAGLATLLADLLTAQEDVVDRQTCALRFDVRLLASRLADVARWAGTQPATASLPLGYFGASTGAAAALIAAAETTYPIFAIVSRGGRPDLAADALPRVGVPTLFIVGGADVVVLNLNRRAATRMSGEVRVEIVPHATHLFEERGALEHVAALAKQWFVKHLLTTSPSGHSASPLSTPTRRGTP